MDATEGKNHGHICVNKDLSQSNLEKHIRKVKAEDKGDSVGCHWLFSLSEPFSHGGSF